MNQYAQLVRQRFPEDELKIEVTNYPVESTRALLAQALSLAKFAFLGIVIANIQVHTMLGIEQPPQFLLWAWENKGYACMMAFFIGMFYRICKSGLFLSENIRLIRNILILFCKEMRSKMVSPRLEPLKFISLGIRCGPN